MFGISISLKKIKIFVNRKNKQKYSTTILLSSYVIRKSSKLKLCRYKLPLSWLFDTLVHLYSATYFSLIQKHCCDKYFIFATNFIFIPNKIFNLKILALKIQWFSALPFNFLFLLIFKSIAIQAHWPETNFLQSATSSMKIKIFRSVFPIHPNIFNKL